EGGERLVEDEQPRLGEEHSAERKALRHAAPVRAEAIGPHAPEAEALEEHPDPLAPFRHAVQPAVQLEVLESGQLAVDERLVGEITDPRTRDAHLDLPLARQRKAGAQTQQGGLPGAVRTGDDREGAVGYLEVAAAQDALLAEALADLSRADH